MSNNVITLDKEQIRKLEQFLLNNGLKQIQNTTGTVFRTDSVVISIYKSGKVLFQGKEATTWYNLIRENYYVIDEKEDFEESKNNKIISNRKLIDEIPRIGTDESGKGDFFGPLVTASFLLQSKDAENKLIAIGVTDSKKISNKQIIALASEIKKLDLIPLSKSDLKNIMNCTLKLVI